MKNSILKQPMNLPKLKKNQSGFTLIELLVVVLVISALSGVVISMINSGGFRDKAKDAQRIGDLKQIQTALELYFADTRAYPAGGWMLVSGLSGTLTPNYINSLPADPDGGTGDLPCLDSTSRRYNYFSNGASYLLTSIMAIESSNDDAQCSDLNGWGANCGGGFDTALYCYGVENP